MIDHLRWRNIIDDFSVNPKLSSCLLNLILSKQIREGSDSCQRELRIGYIIIRIFRVALYCDRFPGSIILIEVEIVANLPNCFKSNLQKIFFSKWGFALYVYPFKSM